MNFTVTSLLAIAFIGIFLYMIQNTIYRKFWSKNLGITLDFSTKQVSEGEEASLVEVVTNKKKLPLSSVNIKFVTSKNLIFHDASNSCITDNYYRNDIFSLLGNQRITRTLNFTCNKRGYYTLETVDIIAYNLFLSSFFVKRIINDNSTINSLYVYPKKIPTNEFPRNLNSLIGNYICKKNLNEDPFEFRGIREYQPFDNMSSINWKISAKNNNLMVNLHNSTSSLKVNIFLNVTFNSEKENEKILEESIRIVSTLTEKFIFSNIPVSFNGNINDIFTDRPISVNYGLGTNKLREINESLSRINIRNSSTDFLPMFENYIIKNTEDTLNILISNYRKKDLCNFFDELPFLKKECIWIVPYDKTLKFSIQSKNSRNLYPWEV